MTVVEPVEVTVLVDVPEEVGDEETVDAGEEVVLAAPEIEEVMDDVPEAVLVEAGETELVACEDWVDETEEVEIGDIVEEVVLAPELVEVIALEADDEIVLEADGIAVADPVPDTVVVDDPVEEGEEVLL